MVVDKNTSVNKAQQFSKLEKLHDKYVDLKDFKDIFLNGKYDEAVFCTFEKYDPNKTMNIFKDKTVELTKDIPIVGKKVQINRNIELKIEDFVERVGEKITNTIGRVAGFVCDKIEYKIGQSWALTAGAPYPLNSAGQVTFGRKDVPPSKHRSEVMDKAFDDLDISTDKAAQIWQGKDEEFFALSNALEADIEIGD